MSATTARLLTATALAIVVQACTSGPQVRADGDPSVNLSSYKTFGFFDALSTDKSRYTTLLTSRLKDATRREMEKRGFQYDSGSPQLLVNFNVNLENRADVRSTPDAGFYGYRAGMYGAWPGYPQDVETVHYQVGTLSIDLVDAANKRLVWEGVAQGRVSRDVAENPGGAVDRVVADIFGKFPEQIPEDAGASTSDT